MSREERIRILSLLEQGKISAAEAARLIDAVEAAPTSPARAGAGGERLHVHVTDAATGDTRVRFTVPAGLAQFGLRLLNTGDLAAELADAGITAEDLERMRQALEAGTAGTLLEIDNAAGGYRIVAWID